MKAHHIGEEVGFASDGCLEDCMLLLLHRNGKQWSAIVVNYRALVVSLSEGSIDIGWWGGAEIN